MTSRFDPFEQGGQVVPRLSPREVKALGAFSDPVAECHVDVADGAVAMVKVSPEIQ